MNKFPMFVTVTFAFAGFALLWGLVWSIVIAWAWNISIPHISSGRLPTIDYWQAYGLTLVAGLFKSSGTITTKD